MMARALTAVAAIEQVELDADRREYLADSLPGWRAFDEVQANLAELRDRGWKLAILSNTDPDLLTTSITDAGGPVRAGDHGRRGRARTSPPPATGERSASSRATSTPTSTSPRACSTTSRPPADLGLPMVWINRLGEESDLPRTVELPDLNGLADAVESAAG